MNRKQQLFEGVFTNNPVLVQQIGLCATMAISTTLFNGIGMGLSVLIILTCCNVVVSLIRKIIPEQVRLTIVDLLLQAFIPALSDALGVFIPLIVVNCIIIGRAEAFSSKNSVKDSFFDGVFQGLGYTVVLICMCLFRELLGSGTIGGGLLNGATSFFTLDGTGAGIRIFPQEYAMGALTLPFGGFLTLGLLMALMQHMLSKRDAKRAAKDKEEDE